MTPAWITDKTLTGVLGISRSQTGRFRSWVLNVVALSKKPVPSNNNKKKGQEDNKVKKLNYLWLITIVKSYLVILFHKAS